MSYRLEQGIIQRYRDARTCDVLQMPDHFLYSEVRLPETLQNQTKPLVGSTVMLATEDGFKSYVIAVLREPLSLISKTDSLRGNTTLNKLQLQPGEIFLESRGPAESPQPGAGATLFLGNDGTASIYSGKRKEYLILGGTDDDDDGEVLLVGDNGFYESNVNHLTSIQSVYRFDENNKLQMGNVFVVLPPPTPITPPVEIPQAELTIDTLSNIVLRNTTAGVDKAYLKIDTTGQIKIANLLASETFGVSGDISASAGTSYSLTAGSTITINASSSIALTGSTINLNSGTFGVARIQDTVTSDPTTDPAWWSAWTTLFTSVSTLVPATSPATAVAHTNALQVYLIAFASVTQQIISKITTGSSTVKAGG